VETRFQRDLFDVDVLTATLDGWARRRMGGGWRIVWLD
jgi:hypothetical protein